MIEVETKSDLRSAIALRFGNRCADEEVVAQLGPLAAHADDGSGQTASEQVDGRTSADLPVVHACVQFCPALTHSPTDVVADEPAALAQQARLAVEAADCVAASDGEAVLRRQRRAVPLRPDQARVAQLLLAELERGVETDVGGIELQSRRTFAELFFRRNAGAKAARAALVGQRALERRIADELLVVQAELQATDHAVLHLDFSVVHEVT